MDNNKHQWYLSVVRNIASVCAETKPDKIATMYLHTSPVDAMAIKKLCSGFAKIEIGNNVSTPFCRANEARSIRFAIQLKDF